MIVQALLEAVASRVSFGQRPIRGAEVNRRLIRCVSAFLVAVAAWLPASVAYATLGVLRKTPVEVQAAQIQAQAVVVQSEVAKQIALIYGAAIVLAGVAIGAGIYFALRHMRQSEGSGSDAA